MAVKKKRRTAKQIAATKKLVALNKKRRAAAKKKAPRKKKAINARSQVTKKAPSARLKRRRAANTRAGYFPNPIFYVAFVRVGDSKYYYSGFDPKAKRGTFDDDIEKALWYRDKAKAIAEVEYIAKQSGAIHPRKHKVEAERYKPGK